MVLEEHDQEADDQEEKHKAGGGKKQMPDTGETRDGSDHGYSGSSPTMLWQLQVSWNYDISEKRDGTGTTTPDKTRTGHPPRTIEDLEEQKCWAKGQKKNLRDLGNVGSVV